MTDKIGIAILAAGKGTRLRVDTPKALIPMLGKPLLGYVLDEILTLPFETRINVVVGHQKEKIIEFLSSNEKYKNINYSIQKEQNGTGDALKAYFEGDESLWSTDYTFVLCADTPRLRASTLMNLYEEMKKNKHIDGIAATFIENNPKGYGRIIREGSGFDIIEEKDASTFEKEIKEVNSGLYLLKTSHIKNKLLTLTNKNNSKEYYLTDLFKKIYNVVPKLFDDSSQFRGINTMLELEELSLLTQKDVCQRLMIEGVRFINSSTNYIEPTVEVKSGTVIYPGVVLEGQTKVNYNVLLESGVVLKNCEVGENAKVLAYSYLEDSKLERDVSVGPFARIRPGAILKSSVKIGNFVEVKKSTLHEGSKVSHLSYVGDAEIGIGTNIGCGFITCNYDGANKHKTKIGDHSFIGSDCQMIAPIEIGNNAYVASGSTINKDVPDGAFAIARSRQETKEGMAKKFLKSKKES